MPREECIHELDPASCATCNGAERRARAEQRPAGVGPQFRASYPGRCGGCEGGIEPGDLIRADGEGGYLCRECGADQKIFPEHS